MTCHCRSCGEAPDKRYAMLDEKLAELAGQPGALIPALHAAQEIFGYLPEDAMIRVAEAVGVNLAEVYGVATFYSLFSLEPRGRHTIGVCMGTACYVNGADALLERLSRELGIGRDQTTKDGLFTLTVTRCVGACGLAPVMTIGDDVYGRLAPDKIPEIIAKYRGDV